MVKSEGSVNQKVEITSFWAPFLLLHLDGPDTITAYALEDSELWLRHFLGLLVQAGAVLSILFMAWTAGPGLSILTLLMTVAGLIKYSERTWVLRSASNEQLRRSLPSQNINDDTKWEPSLLSDKEFELIAEFRKQQESISEEKKLTVGIALSKLIRCLLAEGLIGRLDQQSINFTDKDLSSESTFKVIEIALRLMYDFLYTKASLLYTFQGICLRIISFSLACISLVLLCLSHHWYAKVDVFITLLLLGAAIIIEIYTALLQLCSDQAVGWSISREKCSTLRATALILSKTPRYRWSNAMPQLLSYIIEEKYLRCRRIMSLVGVGDTLEKHKYIAYKQISDDLKEWIFNSIMIVTKSRIILISSGWYGQPEYRPYPV